jgi:phosphonopyruvate decarboxylase
MITADEFLGPARERGLDFFTGVPCSFLTPLINGVIGDPNIDYVGAASEGEAVAISAGAWLAGRNPVVMCQNSGLGNAVNPLTSLNFPFRIPTLLIVTWRGQPGLNDEPQHELMGHITGSLLDLLMVPHRPFPRAADKVAPALDDALAEMARTGLPYAFILDKGAVGEATLDHPRASVRPPGDFEDLREGGARPSRIRALERFLGLVPATAAVISTTGKCGRELFTLADRPPHLYQVGSMGGASAMGLGLALNLERPVVVLDGDGAALMKMGTLATIGARAPANLVHVLLDNGVHDSTGGQSTVSASVDFAQVALACGYAYAAACDNIEGFGRALKRAFGTPGPSLLHLHITPGSIDKLGRPTIKPEAVARRFKSFLAEDRTLGRG